MPSFLQQDAEWFVLTTIVREEHPRRGVVVVDGLVADDATVAMSALVLFILFKKIDFEPVLYNPNN